MPVVVFLVHFMTLHSRDSNMLRNFSQSGASGANDSVYITWALAGPQGDADLERKI